MTHLYVEGIGTVRYASYLDRPRVHPRRGLLLLADVLVLQPDGLERLIVAGETTSWDPVAVNVSATYVDTNGAVAYFVGVYEFNITSSTIVSEASSPVPRPRRARR